MKPISLGRCSVMKCFIGFPVTLKCLTLNVILRCHFILKSVFIVGLTTFFFCLDFEDNYVKTNEDTAIESATKMFARDSSFRRH